MSDDFDIRLRRELRALADAVPTGSTVRPAPVAALGRPSVSLDRERPVLARVRVRHGMSVGWSAAAIGLVLVVVAGVAMFGGGRGKPGGSGASGASGSSGSIAPTTPIAGLTTIQPQIVASFGADDLTAAVLGSDGAAYVLDSTTGAVYWVNLQTGAKLPVVSVNQESPAGGGAVGRPQLLTTGGVDILVLDDFNSLWRWRPAPGDRTGRGALIKVNIPDNASWGVGPRAIGTFVVDANQNLYNIYVAVPSLKQILKYPPAPDGSGYPTAGRAMYLSLQQDVSKLDDMYVDGKIYLVEDGAITQYQLGQVVKGWSVDAPPDKLIRPQAPWYKRLTADNPNQDEGTFYAYDSLNRRIVAFKKSDGSIVGQYMVPSGTPWFTDLTGMFVVPGPGRAAATLYWIESGNLMSAALPLADDATPTMAPAATSTPVATATTRSTATAGPTPKPSPASSVPGQFTPGGTLTTDGGGPATMLADGRVLVLGSRDRRAEVRDPATGTFTATGSMITARSDETATLLLDGTVLIAGGAEPSDVADSAVSSAEIYDPATGTFSRTGSMKTARFDHTATLLRNGLVLVAGGTNGADSLSEAELYNPATGTFSSTGSMLEPLAENTATLLADGQVLITGGVNHASADQTAELYDPVAGTFSATGMMVESAAAETATLLGDGRVLIAGGGDEGPTTAGAQLYDPKSGTFSRTGSMGTPRQLAGAALLRDGRVLVAGGSNGTLQLATAEVYDPATGTFAPTGSMSLPGTGLHATLLTDGRVLITGGLAAAEVWEPSNG
jgi:hypothetical protein